MIEITEPVLTPLQCGHSTRIFFISFDYSKRLDRNGGELISPSGKDSALVACRPYNQICIRAMRLEATEQDLNLHGKLSERPRGVEPHLPSPHFQPLSLHV